MTLITISDLGGPDAAAEPGSTSSAPVGRLTVSAGGSSGSVALDRLEAFVRNRLKRLQHLSSALDGFLAATGLALDRPPPSPKSRSQ